MKNISLVACLMVLLLKHSIFTSVNKDASGYCLSFHYYLQSSFYRHYKCHLSSRIKVTH